MTEQVKKPAVEKDQGKSEFFQKVKDGAEALLSITVPTEGMTLEDMKKGLEILSDEHVKLRVRDK